MVMSSEAHTAHEPPHLRLARPEDLPATVALLEANRLPAAELERHLAHFVVAELGGRIVGCGGLEAYPEASAGLMRSIAVEDKLRGTALGTRLTEWVLERAASLGLARLYLFTMAAPDFFARFAFQQVALDDFPAAVRRSAQYRAVRHHGHRWPNLMAMCR